MIHLPTDLPKNCSKICLRFYATTKEFSYLAMGCYFSISLLVNIHSTDALGVSVQRLQITPIGISLSEVTVSCCT